MAVHASLDSLLLASKSIVVDGDARCRCGRAFRTKMEDLLRSSLEGDFWLLRALDLLLGKCQSLFEELL
jgi:hypothetical protein